MAAAEREGPGRPPLAIGAPSQPSLPGDKLIDVAVQFLNNPDVRQASLDKRRGFLRKRGLTALQIAEALRRSEAAADTFDELQVRRADDSSGRPWLVYSVVLGILASAGVGLYNFFDIYVLPFMEQRNQQHERLQQLETAAEATQATLTSTVDSLRVNVSSIQESLRKIEQDVAVLKTSSRVASDREQSIADVRADVRTVKSLLLSRNQFASTPVQRPTIPAWQRAAASPSQSAGQSSAETQCNGADAAAVAVGTAAAGTSQSPSLSPVTPRSDSGDDGDRSSKVPAGTHTSAGLSNGEQSESPASSLFSPADSSTTAVAQTSATVQDE